MKPLICAVTGDETKRRGGLFHTHLPSKDGEVSIAISVLVNGKNKPVSETGLAKLMDKADFSDRPAHQESKPKKKGPSSK